MSLNSSLSKPSSTMIILPAPGVILSVDTFTMFISRVSTNGARHMAKQTNPGLRNKAPPLPCLSVKHQVYWNWSSTSNHFKRSSFVSFLAGNQIISASCTHLLDNQSFFDRVPTLSKAWNLESFSCSWDRSLKEEDISNQAKIWEVASQFEVLKKDLLASF